MPDDIKQLIVSAVSHLSHPVGKSSLAKALRGSRAKSLNKCGLLELAEHGRLRAWDEAALVRAIEQLISDGALARRGRKYPTVWLAGRNVRPTTSTAAPRAWAERALPRRPRYSDLVRGLDNYRKRVARQLGWKTYMVFQRRVIVAVDRQRPTSLAELAKVPGLGPAKIARFGAEILALVQKHPRAVPDR